MSCVCRKAPYATDLPSVFTEITVAHGMNHGRTWSLEMMKCVALMSFRYVVMRPGIAFTLKYYSRLSGILAMNFSPGRD